MFRVDQNFKMDLQRVLQTQGKMTQEFRLVEQCLNLPLWHIRVLPKGAKRDEPVRWIRILTSSATDALSVLAGEWHAERVSVVIPEYLTGTGEVEFGKCTALWECGSHEDEHPPLMLCETDRGAFVEPDLDQLTPEDLRKVVLRWPRIISCSEHSR